MENERVENRLEKFLKNLRTDSTRKNYRSGIISFIEFIYEVEREGKRATKAENERFFELADKYLDQERNYEDDLREFAVSLQSKPPMTARSYFTAVEKFLFRSGIELKARTLDDIKGLLPRGGAKGVEDEIDKETIDKILKHMDLKGKSLILTLASSGIRINEALQITLDDINLDSKPPRISLRPEYTRTKMQRITFISKEAKNMLDEWLNVREKYIKESLNKNKGFVKKGIGTKKAEDDNRIYPFSRSVIDQMWEKALSNAKLLFHDKSTKRKTLRIHQMRKFFRTQLGDKVDIVEALMGHEGYLTNAYRRYTNKQLAEYYLKNERLLYISMSDEDIEEVKNQLEKKFDSETKDIKAGHTKNADAIGEMYLEIKGLKKEVQKWQIRSDIMKKKRDRLKVERDHKQSENERLQFLEESYETLIELLLCEDEVEKDCINI
ncbi:MAG: site-specific integrase [Methanosarcinales archaeon]|nr:site-specific integrase [Methanosarcinales archaeon]